MLGHFEAWDVLRLRMFWIWDVLGLGHFEAGIFWIWTFLGLGRSKVGTLRGWGRFEAWDVLYWKFCIWDVLGLGTFWSRDVLELGRSLLGRCVFEFFAGVPYRLPIDSDIQLAQDFFLFA